MVGAKRGNRADKGNHNSKIAEGDFAVWYWELDRGGPLERASAPKDYPDFLFLQSAISLVTAALVVAKAVNALH